MTKCHISKNYLNISSQVNNLMKMLNEFMEFKKTIIIYQDYYINTLYTLKYKKLYGHF